MKSDNFISNTSRNRLKPIKHQTVSPWIQMDLHSLITGWVSTRALCRLTARKMTSLPFKYEGFIPYLKEIIETFIFKCSCLQCKKQNQTITYYSVTGIFKVSNTPCLAFRRIDHIMVRCRNPLTITVHVIILQILIQLHLIHGHTNGFDRLQN